ncbi:MAG: GNAT family N-acetyltransferase [Deltaproteobacteria bacterium]|nr:GNAT family N-acetyltransferase [Deltaproteobacteria bacterium]
MTSGKAVVLAEVADVDALFDVLRAASPTGWSRAQLLEELEHDDAEVFCFEKGGLRAFLAARRIGDEFWVMEVATHPDSRRRGAARALLQKAMSRAADEGLPLWLEVRASNVAAIALYLDCGFVELGRRPGYYRSVSGREDALQMRWLPVEAS